MMLLWWRMWEAFQTMKSALRASWQYNEDKFFPLCNFMIVFFLLRVNFQEPRNCLVVPIWLLSISLGGSSLRLSAYLPWQKELREEMWSLPPHLPRLTPLPTVSVVLTLLPRGCSPITETEKRPGGPSVFTSVEKVTSAVPGLEFVYLSLRQWDFVYRPFCYVPPERGKLPLSNCWRRHKPGKFDLSMQFESGNARINNRSSWMQQVCAL